MKNMMKELKQSPVLYYPILNRLTNNVKASILLSQIIYWFEKSGDRPFYKTNEDFCQELDFTLDELKGAKTIIRDLNFVNVFVEGMPPRTYYSVNIQLVEKSLIQLVENPPINKWENHLTCGGKSTSTLYTENTRELVSNKFSTPADEKTPLQKEEKSLNTDKELPSWLGQNSIKRIIKLYSIIWEDRYGFAPTITNWGMLGKMINSMKKQFSEIQIGALVCMHFDWHGASGTDDFVFKRLSEKCFPLAWLGKSANEYRAYMQNELGVDFTDDKASRVFVAKFVTPIIKKLKRN